MALEGVIVENYNIGPDEQFTVRDDFAKEMTNLQNLVKDNNQHVILGLKSGITYLPGFKYYDNLISSTCVVLDLNGKPLIGNQEQTVVYPDYQMPAQIASYFLNSLTDLYSSFPFTGL